MPQTTLPSKPSGKFVSYYIAHVKYPQRPEQEPYNAECEDIIEALSMTQNESNIFKAIWRSAAARLGDRKPGLEPDYDADKIVHYAHRHQQSVYRKLGRPGPAWHPQMAVTARIIFDETSSDEDTESNIEKLKLMLKER